MQDGNLIIISILNRSCFFGNQIQVRIVVQPSHYALYFWRHISWFKGEAQTQLNNQLDRSFASNKISVSLDSKTNTSHIYEMQKQDLLYLMIHVQ
jgi:hypothetical protein